MFLIAPHSPSLKHPGVREEMCWKLLVPLRPGRRKDAVNISQTEGTSKHNCSPTTTTKEWEIVIVFPPHGFFLFLTSWLMNACASFWSLNISLRNDTKPAFYFCPQHFLGGFSVWRCSWLEIMICKWLLFMTFLLAFCCIWWQFVFLRFHFITICSWRLMTLSTFHTDSAPERMTMLNLSIFYMIIFCLYSNSMAKALAYGSTATHQPISMDQEQFWTIIHAHLLDTSSSTEGKLHKMLFFKFPTIHPRSLRCQPKNGGVWLLIWFVDLCVLMTCRRVMRCVRRDSPGPLHKYE